MSKIVSIQYLRAVAVLLVVILHNTTELAVHAPQISVFEKGNFGVDLFFVISGFIMWVLAASRPTGSLAFIKDRVLRIWPLYAVMTIVTAFVTTDGGLSVNFAIDWIRLIASLFFVPQWHESYPLVAPVLFVGWTLNLEMAFYVIFAGLLSVTARWRLWLLCGLLFSIASARLIIGEPTNPALHLYTYSLIAEFGFGALLGAWYLRQTRKPAPQLGGEWTGIFLIGAGVVLLSVSEHLTQARVIHYGAPALFIVSGLLMCEAQIFIRRYRPLEFLGDASYAIYLTHIMVLSISDKLLGAPFGPSHTIAVLVAQTAFAFLVGSLVHVFLEKPLTKAIRHMRRSSTRETPYVIPH